MGLGAAIDIGSNAVRLIIAKEKSNKIEIIKKMRAPVRLGESVFKNGVIDLEHLHQLKLAFESFKLALEDYKIKKIVGVATSAVRESKNQKEVLAAFNSYFQVDLQIINSQKEAELVYLAVCNTIVLNQRPTLIMDIGGGSVEFIYSKKNKIENIVSYPMGTVKTLSAAKGPDDFKGHFDYLISFTSKLKSFYSSLTTPPDLFVSTGGSSDLILRLKNNLINITNKNNVTIEELNFLTSFLKKYSYKDRIQKLKIRPDRADVIMPACQLLQNVCEVLSLNQVEIPQVGVREGLIYELLQT